MTSTLVEFDEFGQPRLGGAMTDLIALELTMTRAIAAGISNYACFHNEPCVGPLPAPVSGLDVNGVCGGVALTLGSQVNAICIGGDIACAGDGTSSINGACFS